MKRNLMLLAALSVMCYVFFFLGNGLVSLTNPDEVFYSQTAKEMVQHHSWMTPLLFGQPQFEKPIFLFWLMKLAFLVAGPSNYAARFFPAVFGLIGVLAVYGCARLLFKDSSKAFVCSLVMLSSGFYIGLARTVFTDMVFSVLILLALLSFIWGYMVSGRREAGILVFFFCAACAVLTKGPLGLIIPLLIVLVFLMSERNIGFLRSKATVLGMFVFCAAALPWYIFMVQKYGQAFIQEFFYNDHLRRLLEAEHASNDRWYFYPVSMLLGMFPWTVFVGAAFFRGFRSFRHLSVPVRFLFCWVFVTLAIFQFAHSKLASYIFPLFPAMAMLCGDYLYEGIQHRTASFIRLMFFCASIFLVIVVGIIGAGFHFSHYLSSTKPIYIIAAFFVVWVGAIFFFLFRRRLWAAVALSMFFVPIGFIGMPFIHNDIEPYFSSKEISRYLMDTYSPAPGSYMIASKPFARGALFYTGLNVAVFASYTPNYFSPHPVVFLDTDENARAFFSAHPCVYGFLKKNGLHDLERVAQDKFEVQMLKKIGDQYLVRIEKKPAA